MIHSIASASARPVSRTLATFYPRQRLPSLFASPGHGAAARAGTRREACACREGRQRRRRPGGPRRPQPRRLLPRQRHRPRKQPTLIYFAMGRNFCLKGQEANAKQVCFTGKDGRLEIRASRSLPAVIIEPEGADKKTAARDVAPRHASAARHGA